MNANLFIGGWALLTGMRNGSGDGLTMTLWLNIQTLSRMTISTQVKTVGCLHQSMSSDGLTLNVQLTTPLFAN
ncbi:hypothetical protein DPMN_135050 [Dreissena polymorpha]|uniref:Uncharacterized protein n=1 Tax=Dreissena polymorpha TaxID=45954 RepID=A0A9D4G0T9_DREPO|nr:hypothetical protein DPMN_135050 [Dreissena polymorpha]